MLGWSALKLAFNFAWKLSQLFAVRFVVAANLAQILGGNNASCSIYFLEDNHKTYRRLY
jgi:hypothetical protein